MMLCDEDKIQEAMYVRYPSIHPSIYSGCVPTAPRKTYTLELRDALGRHVRLHAGMKQLVLAALALHPHRQLLVRSVRAGHVAVSVLGAVLDQVRQAILPRHLVVVPREADSFQRLLSLVGQRRMLPFHLELVLVPLPLHPLGQGRVGRILVRDEAVAVRLLVLQQLLEALVPQLLVEGVDDRLVGACR